MYNSKMTSIECMFLLIYLFYQVSIRTRIHWNLWDKAQGLTVDAPLKDPC